MTSESLLNLDDELRDFYARSGFGPVVGQRMLTVPVYTGCMLVPLPNIETRRRYLKYHDLHHLVTGYSVGRIGEGEVSAWELGTGSARISPLLGMMNLIALSTGLVLEPRRMWRAFESGCRSRNLYAASERADVDDGRWSNLDELRQYSLEVGPDRAAGPVRVVEFSCYAGLALATHAAIAIPAMVSRLVTDISLGMNLFQAIKPVKRTDLY